MHFEIAHEFDAPLDVIELAVLSPDLGPMLARALAPSIASVETLVHLFAEGEFRRVLGFQAAAPVKILDHVIDRDALAWELHDLYRLVGHASTWSLSPKPYYHRYFRGHGTYKLDPCPDGRTRRTVVGELEFTLPVPMLGGIAERVALVEVRKTYDAEAETLRRLATL